MGQAGRLSCSDRLFVAGISIRLRPLRYWPVSELLRLQNLRVSALEHDLAARGAVAGAEVNDLVRGADHAGLVFDDHDGVAGIAQLLEQADQAFGVARVQADARLVQHEERIHQAGAQAGGEIDALGFAAGERARRAIQRQIAQADLVEIARAASGPRSGPGRADRSVAAGAAAASASMKGRASRIGSW